MTVWLTECIHKRGSFGEMLPLEIYIYVSMSYSERANRCSDHHTKGQCYLLMGKTFWFDYLSPSYLSTLTHSCPGNKCIQNILTILTNKSDVFPQVPDIMDVKNIYSGKPAATVSLPFRLRRVTKAFSRANPNAPTHTHPFNIFLMHLRNRPRHSTGSHDRRSVHSLILVVGRSIRPQLVPEPNLKSPTFKPKHVRHHVPIQPLELLWIFLLCLSFD